MKSMTGVTNGSLARAFARRARITRVILGVAAAGLLTSACDVHGTSSPGTSAPGTRSTLSVSPDPKTLAVNGTQQFAAVGTDFAGVSVSITPEWSVVAGGGTTSSSGFFTAGTTPGTYASTVQATSGDFTAGTTAGTFTGTVRATSGAIRARRPSPSRRDRWCPHGSARPPRTASWLARRSPASTWVPSMPT